MLAAVAGRQPDAELGATLVADQRQRPAVRLYYGVGDCQAEAGAALGPRPRGVGTPETVEDGGLQLYRDARAVVADRQQDVVLRLLITAQPDHDRGPGRGMDARVGEQVGHHLVQTVLVAAYDQWLVWQVERPWVVGAGHSRIAGDLDDQPGQVDVLLLQRAAGVEPGKEQEVVHEQAHPNGFGLDPSQCVAHLLGDSLGAAPG